MDVGWGPPGGLVLAFLVVIATWSWCRYYRRSRIHGNRSPEEHGGSARRKAKSTLDADPDLSGAPTEVVSELRSALLGPAFEVPMRRLTSFFRLSSDVTPRDADDGLAGRCRLVWHELCAEAYDPTAAPARISVRRSDAWASSIRDLLRADRCSLLAGAAVEFEGEDAVDAGGVVNEWCTAVAASLLEPEGPLSLLPDGTVTLSTGTSAASAMALGRLAAAVVVWAAQGVVEKGSRSAPTLAVPLSRAIAKLITGERIEERDVECLDPEFFRARIAIARAGQEGIESLAQSLGVEELHFCWYDAQTAEPTPLRPNGDQIAVTIDNADEFVRETAEFYFIGRLRRQAGALVKGVENVLGTTARTHLTYRDVQLLLAGLRHVDPDEWRRYSSLERGGVSDEDAERLQADFWHLVRTLDPESRTRLLLFATGSVALPPGGFPALLPRFVLVLDPTAPTYNLPSSFTCFNRLHLPLYKSKHELATKLDAALHLGLGPFTRT